VEGARWWKNQLGITHEEWETLIAIHSSVAESAGAGCFDNGRVNVVIFLGQLNLYYWSSWADLLIELVDCWLHEYIEVTEEVNNHDTFNDTVTGIAKYVLAL
jgi:hypothetical protein